MNEFLGSPEAHLILVALVAMLFVWLLGESTAPPPPVARHRIFEIEREAEEQRKAREAKR